MAKKYLLYIIRVDVILQHESVDESLDTFLSLLCVSNPHQKTKIDSRITSWFDGFFPSHYVYHMKLAICFIQTNVSTIV